MNTLILLLILKNLDEILTSSNELQELMNGQTYEMKQIHKYQPPPAGHRNQTDVQSNVKKGA